MIAETERRDDATWIVRITDEQRRMLCRAVILALPRGAGPEARAWATLLSTISGTDTVLIARRAYAPRDYRGEEPDTSDIPEADEAWFRRARRRDP